MLGQDCAGGLLRVTGEVRTADALLGDDLDVGILLLNRLLEAVIALAGHEEVGGVED